MRVATLGSDVEAETKELVVVFYFVILRINILLKKCKI